MKLAIGAPIQGAFYLCPDSGGIRFAQTPRLLSGDAFSVIKHQIKPIVIEFICLKEHEFHEFHKS
ncbi:MAG: hypothetical protein J6U65_02330, partial [Bacteroidaceae bacterium]|nr:hypothetical protein [Bacteroidaceae bacterium]